MTAAQDRARSPYTGWTRETWERHAEHLLSSARRHASPGHAGFAFPGPPSAQQPEADRLEGYARTFLLAGFLLAGAGGTDRLGLAEWYAEGLANGTDPGSAEAWPRLDTGIAAQPKVEAASIALVLALTREQLWDKLDDRVRGQVIAWLGQAVGAPYPGNNWIWFQILVQTFLASVGGPYDRGEIERRLEQHERFVRPGGWYADGAARAFDHYNGWALHFYPLLWARIEPDASLVERFRPRYEDRLRSYLRDAVHLVGVDGSPLVQGRSLTYRFAAAAPFWMGALSGATDLAPGLLRRAASGIVRHFAERGAPDADGMLPLGWHRAHPAIRQRYSGPGSPYWAAKGMLGLALPATHPVWTAVEEPLPVERGDFVRTVAAPAWAVAGTAGDGIVRTANHGSDPWPLGELSGEMAEYHRVGYSTATVPTTARADGTSGCGGLPESTVTLLDAAGTAGRRTGYRPLFAAQLDGAAVAASVHRAHWPAERDGGGSITGPLLTVVSALRGAWEVRIVRVDHDDAVMRGGRLRITGWALSDDAPPTHHRPAGDRDAAVRTVTGRRLVSEAYALLGCGASGTADGRDISPVGRRTALPWVGTDGVPAGRTYHAAALRLAAGEGGAGREAAPALVLDADTATVNWPDGSTSSLPFVAAAAATGGRA